MMKKIVFIVIAFVASLQLSAQDKVELNKNPNAPVISFESNVIEYGDVARGSDGVRYFNFTNAGKEPLIISNVRSSCGCTIPEYPRIPIGPNQESQIKIKYDTKRVGPFRKTITIYSNVEGKAITVTIKGRVLAEK
jgi:hypothetical protein